MRALLHQTAGEMHVAPADARREAGAALEFDAVYAETVGFVWRVLRGMGVPDGLIEDVVQDVFLVVHRRLAQFDGRHSIRTWIFAIAFRVSRDHLRRARRASGQELLEERLVDGRPMPDESAERAEALRVLSGALAELDDEKRAVLWLTDVEGMSAQEVAAATGAGINTVYTRVRRARLQLNQVLAARQKRMR